MGETPVVAKTGRRFSVNMISAVMARGHCRFMVHQGTVHGRVFKSVLQRLVADAPRSVFVIVDGHPAHRTRLVRDYVASTNGRLQLFIPPPYAPHLNGDETVCSQVKRYLGKLGVESLEHM